MLLKLTRMRYTIRPDFGTNFRSLSIFLFFACMAVGVDALSNNGLVRCSQRFHWSSHVLTSFTNVRTLPRERSHRNTIKAPATITSNPKSRLRHSTMRLQALPPVPEVFSSLFAPTNVPLWQAFAVNAALFTFFSSKLLKSLTPEGFAHAMALGTLLWATLGYRGWLVCVAYLILGSIVTKIRFEEKVSAGIAEARGGRRGPENVWGSALTALLCASCSVHGSSFLGIESTYYVLAFAASLATKLADTFASEIGKAYGKTTFLITTLEKVPPGTEGAVSAEGTAAAVVGGLLISFIAYILFDEISFPGGVAICAVASFLATNVESVIGATTQGKEGFRWMTNEVVNFLNTLIGAAIAITGGKLLLGH